MPLERRLGHHGGGGLLQGPQHPGLTGFEHVASGLALKHQGQYEGLDRFYLSAILCVCMCLFFSLMYLT